MGPLPIGTGQVPLGTRPIKTTKVWDPLVRLFHWGTVACVTLNLFILRAGKPVHRYVGYTLLGLLACRFIWGFIGTPYARFSQFVPSPKGFITYAGAWRHGHEPRFLGHNPAGAIMVLVLMAVLTWVGITGWMMTLDQFWGEEWLEDIHGLLANSLYFLVPLHILGAVIASKRHRENLIWSMVTGKKSI